MITVYRDLEFMKTVVDETIEIIKSVLSPCTDEEIDGDLVLTHGDIRVLVMFNLQGIHSQRRTIEGSFSLEEMGEYSGEKTWIELTEANKPLYIKRFIERIVVMRRRMLEQMQEIERRKKLFRAAPEVTIVMDGDKIKRFEVNGMVLRDIRSNRIVKKVGVARMNDKMGRILYYDGVCKFVVEDK